MSRACVPVFIVFSSIWLSASTGKIVLTTPSLWHLGFRLSHIPLRISLVTGSLSLPPYNGVKRWELWYQSMLTSWDLLGLLCHILFSWNCQYPNKFDVLVLCMERYTELSPKWSRQDIWSCLLRLFAGRRWLLHVSHNSKIWLPTGGWA